MEIPATAESDRGVNWHEMRTRPNSTPRPAVYKKLQVRTLHRGRKWTVNCNMNTQRIHATQIAGWISNPYVGFQTLSNFRDDASSWQVNHCVTSLTKWMFRDVAECRLVKTAQHLSRQNLRQHCFKNLRSRPHLMTHWYTSQPANHSPGSYPMKTRVPKNKHGHTRKIHVP